MLNSALSYYFVVDKSKYKYRIQYEDVK